ncbi:MAG: rhodanese-like domain-containing protein [Candidatus Yanofskybacteria bacterium]|nr:rhodanese-like domain-containing protein [Candidatus Yanofskybacteria bacterium]
MNANAAQAVAGHAAGKSVVLDVRRDDEWAAGHAEGALHWELARLEGGEMPDVPKDATVYTYCAAGGRAGKAAEILAAHGWERVASIGGLKDWEEAGGAVEHL